MHIVSVRGVKYGKAVAVRIDGNSGSALEKPRCVCCGTFCRNCFQTVDFPVYQQGIAAGDTIVALNHYRVHFYQEISIYTFFHPGEEVKVTYLRDGEEYTAMLTPEYNEEAGRYLFGFQGDYTRIRGNIPQTLAYGFYEMKYQIYSTFESLKMLVTGRLSVNDMSGPVGIVKTIGDVYDESADSGAFYIAMNMINIAILLSANLGVMNLLPIPALDGGRLLFFIVEGIRGKKLNEEIEGRIHFIGFALLMSLMVVVMFNDIYKLFI